MVLQKQKEFQHSAERLEAAGRFERQRDGRPKEGESSSKRSLCPAGPDKHTSDRKVADSKCARGGQGKLSVGSASDGA